MGFRFGLTGLLGLVLAAASPAAWAADKSEITVGYTLSQTGKFSSEALDVQRTYDLWRDKVNADGGIMVKEHGKKLPVRFIAYDDKSDPSTAAKLYERLITEDNADLLLSPWGSGVNFAVTAVTEKHGKNMVLTSASSDAIYGRGYKHVYQTSGLASRVINPLVDLLHTRQDDIKTVAVLYENNIFPESVYNNLVNALKEGGPKIVMAEKHPQGAQSFVSLLTKAKGMNPDALIVLSLMPDTIYTARQAREVGLNPKMYYALMGPMFKEFRDALGNGTEGLMENGYWHPALPYAGAKEFAAEFEKRYERPPSTDAAHGWIAAQVLTQAVEKAGTLTQDKLTEVLHSAEFQTINGTYKYDEAGRNVNETPFLVQVQKGQRTIVWPKSVAEAAPQVPMKK